MHDVVCMLVCFSMLLFMSVLRCLFMCSVRVCMSCGFGCAIVVRSCMIGICVCVCLRKLFSCVFIF